MPSSARPSLALSRSVARPRIRSQCAGSERLRLRGVPPKERAFNVTRKPREEQKEDVNEGLNVEIERSSLADSGEPRRG